MKRIGIVLVVALSTPLLFVASAEAHTLQPVVSCTQATFTFVHFKAGVSHAIDETVSIDGEQVATDSTTFTGDTGTNAVAINVPVGSHVVALHSEYTTKNHQIRTIDRKRRISGCGIPVCPPTTIDADFNQVAIDGGDAIWFNSSFRVIGGDGSPITFSTHGGQVTFSDGATNFVVPIPDATITFSPTAAQATTTFGAGHWTTVVPAGFADNVFLSGAKFAVPAGGLPGSISPVTWTTNIQSDTPGVVVEWQWAAAAFPGLPGYNAMGVKPLHSATLDQYPNGDEAGTVENYGSTGGARGYGDGDGHGANTSSASCGGETQ